MIITHERVCETETKCVPVDWWQILIVTRRYRLEGRERRRRTEKGIGERRRERNDTRNVDKEREKLSPK